MIRINKIMIKTMSIVTLWQTFMKQITNSNKYYKSYLFILLFNYLLALHKFYLELVNYVEILRLIFLFLAILEEGWTI